MCETSSSLMLLGQAQSLLEQLLSEPELDAHLDDSRARAVRAGLEAVLSLLRHHRSITRSYHELNAGSKVARSRANTLDSCSGDACNGRRAQTEHPLTNGKRLHEEARTSKAAATSESHTHCEHSLSAGDLIDEDRLAARCDSDGNIRRVKVLINEDELEDFDGQVNKLIYEL